MASADFLRFVVTPAFAVRKTSRDKSRTFPRLPVQFTNQGYGCLLDFTALCQLIRLIRLLIDRHISALWLPVRRATISLSLLLACTSQHKPWESLLGSLATAPLETFTPGSGHARHTKNSAQNHVLNAIDRGLRFTFSKLCFAVNETALLSATTFRCLSRLEKGLKFAATNGSNPYATRISRFVAIIPSGHTFATLALQNGVDVKTVSATLGHATVAFTLDKYGHVSDTMMQNGAEKMQRFIEGL